MMKFLFVLLSIYNAEVVAYESMIVHGYGRCIVCHKAIEGGGQLGDYGKVMAIETSTFSKFENLKKRKFDQAIQARYAHLQSRGETRNFPMQFDYLATFQKEGFLAELTAAKAPRSTDEEVQFKDQVYLRKALLSYQKGKRWNFSAGRDRQYIGLNLVDHTQYIRKYNKRGVEDFNTVLSVYFQKDKFSLRTTGYLPNWGQQKKYRESGFGLKADWINSRLSLTGSYLASETQLLKRKVHSLAGKFAWKKTLLMAQVDYVDRNNFVESFGQWTHFYAVSMFPVKSFELRAHYESIRRRTPFVLGQNRMGLMSRWRPFSRVGFQVDLSRLSDRSDQFQKMAQVFIYGWFL